MRHLAILFGGLAFGIMLWIVVPRWPREPISPDSFRRIRLGMSAKEVQDCIGLPPGDYYTGFRGYFRHAFSGPIALTRERIGVIPHGRDRDPIWWGNRHVILVAFDEDGRAVGAELMDVYPPEG